MNRKMRNLIEQLGQAIHETVAESDQIAGVVRNIRAEGFEIVLMLEATIGLNEAESETESTKETENAVIGSFTAQDLSFLQSLRIRLTNGTEEMENPE